MKEYLSTASVPTRLEYGAVPLDAWKAKDPEAVTAMRRRAATKLSRQVLDISVQSSDRLLLPYVTNSIRRIAEKSQIAMNVARLNGWFEAAESDSDSELRVEAIASLVERSLLDSHMQRVDRNSRLIDLDQTDARVVHAKEGFATPAELLELLMDYSQLGSIELAKLSHPLDAEASHEMDQAVYRAVTDQLGELSIGAPRYKTKSIAAEIPAVTILRKQSIGEFETSIGTLEVIRRQAFLVRGDEGAQVELGDPFLARKVRNHERHEDDIYPSIEDWVLAPEHEPYGKFIQPLATSYYAKNVATVATQQSRH